MFAGQGTLQAVFVLIAVIAVPVMLFGKPVALTLRQKKRSAAAGASDPSALVVESGDERKVDGDHDDDDNGDHAADEAVASHGGHAHGDESFGDLMFHQSIHSIEYVLGTVSNTASYLRLWALSLAHSELSKVFWDKLFMLGLKNGTWAMIIACWGAWAGITTGVLLLMDVLECFLHALRLHWVEFQNKFFEASGYLFVPFTLKRAQEAE